MNNQEIFVYAKTLDNVGNKVIEVTAKLPNIDLQNYIGVKAPSSKDISDLINHQTETLKCALQFKELIKDLTIVPPVELVNEHKELLSGYQQYVEGIEGSAKFYTVDAANKSLTADTNGFAKAMADIQLGQAKIQKAIADIHKKLDKILA